MIKKKAIKSKKSKKGKIKKRVNKKMKKTKTKTKTKTNLKNKKTTKKRRSSKKGGFTFGKMTLEQSKKELYEIIQNWNNNENNSPDQMLTALIGLHNKTTTLQPCDTDDNGIICRRRKNQYSRSLQMLLIAPPVSKNGIVNTGYYEYAREDLKLAAKKAIKEIEDIIDKREKRQ